MKENTIGSAEYRTDESNRQQQEFFNKMNRYDAKRIGSLDFGGKK